MASFRVTLPNLISFATLAVGISSIALALEGEYRLAASLVLVGYLTDALDGEVARRIQGHSDFGIQLDSLVDIVHFGVANAILLTQYLAEGPLGGWQIWALVTVYMVAGSFRLARFNLTAGSNAKEYTVGLTISTGGAYLALAVLVDSGFPETLFPAWTIPASVLLVSTLMVSRIPFPELQAVLRQRAFSAVAFAAGVVASVIITLPLVWWTTITIYIFYGLVKAAGRALR